MLMRLLAAWTATLALAACQGTPVHFASEPPGARILIDGEDTGFVTPCRIQLPDRSRSTVEFVVPGYQTATRELSTRSRGELVYWRDAAVHYNTWNFPLWLGYRDFFWPYKFQGGEWPRRLYVRLKREADAR